jgi:hypothetical protein
MEGDYTNYGPGPPCSKGRLSAVRTAVKRLMAPATNSKGEVLWAYPYIRGAGVRFALTTKSPVRRG